MPTAARPTCEPRSHLCSYISGDGWGCLLGLGAEVPRTALGKGFSRKALTSPHFPPLRWCPRHEAPVGGRGQLLS